MKPRSFVIRVMAMLIPVLLALAGCGEDSDTARTAGKPPEQTGADSSKGQDEFDLLPALPQGFSVVLEAENGEFEPDMIVEEFSPTRHERFGLQTASGGKCIAIPDKINEKKGRKDNPRGRVTLEFTIPEDGTFYVFPRTWWQDQCGNSFGLLIDGRNPARPPDAPDAAEPLMIGATTSGAHKVWRWTKLKAPGNTTAPRAFRLTAGRHTITFTNREDGVKLDQVYITEEPGTPAEGPMKKPEQEGTQ
jgi:hypothetical protein